VGWTYGVGSVQLTAVQVPASHANPEAHSCAMGSQAAPSALPARQVAPMKYAPSTHGWLYCEETQDAPTGARVWQVPGVPFMPKLTPAQNRPVAHSKSMKHVAPARHEHQADKHRSQRLDLETTGHGLPL